METGTLPAGVRGGLHNGGIHAKRQVIARPPSVRFIRSTGTEETTGLKTAVYTVVAPSIHTYGQTLDLRRFNRR